MTSGRQSVISQRTNTTYAEIRWEKTFTEPLHSGQVLPGPFTWCLIPQGDNGITLNTGAALLVRCQDCRKMYYPIYMYANFFTLAHRHLGSVYDFCIIDHDGFSPFCWRSQAYGTQITENPNSTLLGEITNIQSRIIVYRIILNWDLEWNRERSKHGSLKPVRVISSLLVNNWRGCKEVEIFLSGFARWRCKQPTISLVWWSVKAN